MMECVVYKGSKRYDTYLYVTDEGKFEVVPQPLLEMLGKLEVVMTLSLHKNRKLAQADVQQVMASLVSQGYYLQIPPSAYING